MKEYKSRDQFSLGPLALDIVVALVEESPARLQAGLPVPIVVAAVPKRVATLTLPQSIAVLPLVVLAVGPAEDSPAVELAELPLALVVAEVGIFHFPSSVALVVVEGAVVDLPVGEAIDAMSELFSIHDFALVDVPVLVGLLPLAVGQTLGPVALIDVAGVVVLVPALALSIELGHISDVEAPFLEHKGPFHWLATHDLALEDLPTGEVYRGFSLKLVVVQGASTVDDLGLVLLAASLDSPETVVAIFGGGGGVGGPELDCSVKGFFK